MPSIDLLLAIHDHQPVGNFDSVIESVHERAYRPFLDVLERHEGIRMGLHASGLLWEWWEEHRPETLDRVGALIDAGRIEPITGAYTEPILPSIPAADRVAQIRELSDALTDRFGVRPRTMWPAERVWEPELPASLVDAGVEGVFVDDHHLLAAGVPGPDVGGRYVTESDGRSLSVFPISKPLRYRIPFAEPETVMEWLEARAGADPGGLVVFGDDGEKFGAWPETHDRVYTEGWLETWFTLLERASGRVRTILPSEALAHPVRDRVYLPAAAYAEMMLWALPPDAQRALRDREGEPPAGTGAPWRNFLSRYPESNHWHKRMLGIARRCQRLPDNELRREARAHLWRGQCNCAYWHGVFGGLYLPHLREGIAAELLAAEAVLDRDLAGPPARIAAEAVDLDGDGAPEVLLRSARVSAVLAPGEGGTLRELSLKDPPVALGNTMTRRDEPYHDYLRDAPAPPGNGADASGEPARNIHDRPAGDPAVFMPYLHLDGYRRVSLVDHFLGSGARPADFHKGLPPGPAHHRSAVYSFDLDPAGGVCLEHEGPVWSEGFEIPVRVTKTITLLPEPGALEVAYRLQSGAREARRVRFGVEWNLALMAADAPSHRLAVHGTRPREDLACGDAGEDADADGITATDRVRGFRFTLQWNRPAALWRAPVETVSLSETGFERVYQQTALLPHWDLTVGGGRVVDIVFAAAFNTEPRP